MRKFTLSLVLGFVLLGAWYVSAVTCTPLGSTTANLGLCNPGDGEVGWGNGIRGNNTLLDGFFTNTVLNKANGGTGSSVGEISKGTTLTKNPVVFGTTTTQAHGLSATPNLFTIKFTNLTAECNWSIGDVVYLSPGSGHGNNEGIDIQADVTNVYLHITSLINISNKTTYINCLTTAANWRIDVLSFLVN